jgi:hypothetical protein
MNNIQLNEILKYDEFTKKYFLGCFPLDMIPKITRYPSCIIVNNQISNSSGEHWLAIYYNSKKKATFFDSFGLHPRHYKLEKFLKNTSEKYDYNKIPIQSIFSSYCGYYCLLFLLFISRKKSLKYILKLFKDPFTNDRLINQLINKNGQSNIRSV